MVPAVKFPLPFLATIVFTVLISVAVVAPLDTLPGVLIVASFVSAMAAEAEIFAVINCPGCDHGHSGGATGSRKVAGKLYPSFC